MDRKITFKGSPLTLVGRIIKIGNFAPDFRVISQDLKEVNYSDFKRKIKILASFPSLDTPVCDLQVKEFNKRAAQVSSEVVIIGISKDLPFAQKRFCSMNEIKNEAILSDYKFSSFGINFGLLIKELNLLARSVFIIDKNDIVRYVQIVGELTSPPDYEDVLKNLDIVSKNPEFSSKETRVLLKCIPCEGKVLPLPEDKIKGKLSGCPGWELIENKKIVKEFKFADFIEAKYFLDLIAVVAQDQGHHPTLTLMYNKVKVTLTTHAAGGLTENDFIMAHIIDELG